MPRKRSHSRSCVLLDGRKCQRSQDGKQKPIGLNAPCPKCGEWRCRAHCKCGREGTAKGRYAPRDGKGPVMKKASKRKVKRSKKKKAKVNARPRGEVQVTLPVGRPALVDFVVISDNSWRPPAFAEIMESSVVLLASLVYDDPDLHKVLLRRLKQSSEFECQVV